MTILNAEISVSECATTTRISSNEGPPEFGPSHHVHEKIGRRVDAHQQIAERNQGVDELVAGAVRVAVVVVSGAPGDAPAADEALVNVRDELERLTADKEQGDADERGAQSLFFIGRDRDFGLRKTDGKGRQRTEAIALAQISLRSAGCCC